MRKRILCLLCFTLLLCGCSFVHQESNIPTNPLTPTATPINLVDLNVREVNDDWLTPPNLYEGEFVSSWTLNTGDGAASMQSNYLGTDIAINHGGSGVQAISFARQGFSFVSGNEYVFSFDASSSMERSIDLVITNPTTGEVIQQHTVTLNAQLNNYRFTFKYTNETIFDGMVSFYLGGTNDYYHDLKIYNISCINLSNSNHSVKVNQVGYGSQDSKRVIFSYNEGDFFNVIDDSSGQVVYQGAIIYKGFDQDSNDTIFYGDFSDLTTPGTYHIETQIGGTSVSFTIADYPYDDLMDALLYVFYNQRCGQDVHSSIDGFTHQSCHNQEAILNDGTSLSVSGGWHDAGDYGRYVNTGAQSVLNLLLAYDIAPFHFLDDIGIDESGNGIADILDEVRYELEWILKMQQPNGGFYSKVATKEFADLNVSAQNDQDTLYIKGENRTDIAALTAATLIYASSIYQSIDASFAQQLAESAFKAYEFIQRNSKASVIDIIDEGFVQGNYNDVDDRDQRLLMFASFYYVRQDKKYLDQAVELLNQPDLKLDGTGWNSTGGYALYFLAQSNLSQVDKSIIDLIYDKLNQTVILVGNAISGNGYNYSNEGYGWGSNGEVANDALFLALVYDISANETVHNLAYSTISYLLGRNALNMCFVVGFGTYSPHLIHHRMTISHNGRYMGALVGGPDAYCEDPISQQSCDAIPPAKAYYDNIDSYSTNEMSIYWNAALLAALAILNS